MADLDLTTFHAKKGYDGAGLIVHEREHLKIEARLALQFVEKWGMVMGRDDGEDSAGRAKIGLATVAETVARACEMADETMKSLRNRGWTLLAPSYEDLTAEALRKDNER